ncbi:MAG: MFS transporter [Spirochaetes bacterium]|nr:MFS transporter [Spirochaetota bacterium]
MLTFFSSFGQTFFISLYVPEIMKDINMSKSFFGSVYGVATVFSSIVLGYVGKFIDCVDVRKYTLLTLLLLGMSCAVMAFSTNIGLVFLGFWGLRLAGQGLMSHIANTSISKIYTSDRGSALSLTSLGFPAGELIFPLMVGAILFSAGWRYSMMLNAVLILFMIPVIFVAMKKSGFHAHSIQKTGDNQAQVESFSRRVLLKDPNFYIIAICSTIIPFVVTGLFFHQGSLAQFKQWPAGLFASGMVGYAILRALFSIFSGRLIDRYSAKAIFPVFLIIFASALLIVTIFTHTLIAFLYLFLIGMAIGLSGPVKTAVLAEVYGTENIGGIRSIFSTLMVLCTAVSPALFGLVLDRNWPFTYITGISFLVAIGCIGVSFRLTLPESLIFDENLEG